MSRSLRVLFITLSILLIAHHAPAPIIEGEKPTTTPSKQEAVRFAGTWSGKIKFAGFATEIEYTLIINPQASSLIQKSPRFGENARPTTVNAGMLSWIGGPREGTLWTLTPNLNGESALVKVQPPAGAGTSATFQRIQTPAKRGRADARKKSRE